MTLLGQIFSISIQALLSAPNPDDPLSENIAKHWKTNEAEAVETGIILGLSLIPTLVKLIISKCKSLNTLCRFFLFTVLAFIISCSEGMDTFICQWCLMTWWKISLHSNDNCAMYAIVVCLKWKIWKNWIDVWTFGVWHSESFHLTAHVNYFLLVEAMSLNLYDKMI